MDTPSLKNDTPATSAFSSPTPSASYLEGVAGMTGQVHTGYSVWLDCFRITESDLKDRIEFLMEQEKKPLPEEEDLEWRENEAFEAGMNLSTLYPSKLFFG